MGVTVIHLEGLLQKRGLPHIFSIPKHCVAAKQLNMTLFCGEMSKYGIFCRKLLKYALLEEPKIIAASALRADSTLSPTLERGEDIYYARPAFFHAKKLQRRREQFSILLYPWGWGGRWCSRGIFLVANQIPS